MTGTPLLMAGIHARGFQTTAIMAAAVGIGGVVPTAAGVLKTRPQDLGQLPDGLPATVQSQPFQSVRWKPERGHGAPTVPQPYRPFGLGKMVQEGFLSNHVPIAIPTQGIQGAAAKVLSAAVAALLGRLLLARYADQVDIHRVGGCVFLLATASLVGMAPLPGRWATLATSISFGLTVGNVTTPAPVIIRREFGAASFGMAATLNQLSMSLGPTVYGGAARSVRRL